MQRKLFTAIALSLVLSHSWTTLGAMGGSPFGECNIFVGAERADCACTRAASGRGLRRSSTHQFRAWLSVESSGATVQQDAKCRILDGTTGCSPAFPGPWFHTQGGIVVNDYAGFATAPLVSAIEYDEFGSSQGTNDVWTGTTVGGTAVAATTCQNWTSMVTGPIGRIGNRSSNTNQWTDNDNNNCSNSYRVYCIASPVF